MTDEVANARPYTPQQILEEAHDKLVESYWVEGTEFSWESSPAVVVNGYDSRYDDSSELFNTGIYQEYLASLPKYLWVKHWVDTDYSGDEPTPVVVEKPLVGVCSIGAIALANALIKDKPMQSFEALVDTDWASAVAGYALARVIWDNGWDYNHLSDALASQIASWNDHNEREHVITGFELASKHPVAQAETEIPLLSYQSSHSSSPCWAYYAFADVEEAERFIAFVKHYRTLLGTDTREAREAILTMDDDVLLKPWIRLAHTYEHAEFSYRLFRQTESGKIDLVELTAV
jgi:hypothetical protein